MSHADKLNERLRCLKLLPIHPPWQRLKVHPVGGLTEVGYAPDSDLLLVVSSAGRGLFDCLNGERLARDSTPIGTGDWYDGTGLLAQGIGVIEQQVIRLAGLHGGGLRKGTSDGWGLAMVAPDWPQEMIVVEPPGYSVVTERFAEGCTKIEEDYEFRAFGFSDTGRSFIVASSHSLAIYCRT